MGKAVIRNRVKRVFREILRAAPVEPGWDIVIIARPAADTDYAGLNRAITALLLEAGLVNANKQRALT